MNALPTMQNLKVRGVNTEGRYPICDKCIENTMHALFVCDIPMLAWSYWLSRPAILDGRLMDVIEVALHVIRNGTPHDLKTLFITAWYIWFNQN